MISPVATVMKYHGLLVRCFICLGLHERQLWVPQSCGDVCILGSRALQFWKLPPDGCIENLRLGSWGLGTCVILNGDLS